MIALALVVGVPLTAHAATFSGVGSKAVGPFYLPGGLTTFSWSYSVVGPYPRDNFIVWMYDSSGQSVGLLLNELGPGGSGSGVVHTYGGDPLPEGNYTLAVTTNSVWAFSILGPHSLTATIDRVSSHAVKPGDTVEFGGWARDAHSHAMSYSWSSSIDGELSTSRSFSTSSLSEGTHTIQLRVICEDGTRAYASTQVLVAADEPTATIDSVMPSPAYETRSVTFSGHATDPLGHTITGWEWRSDKDGLLSTTASFSQPALSAGTHRISFRARCSEGEWSTEASQQLTVQPHAVTVYNGTSYEGGWFPQTQTFAYHLWPRDSAGHRITEYVWRSSIDGTVSAGPMPGDSWNGGETRLKVRTPGVHALHVRVRCSHGEWSPESVPTTISVAPVYASAVKVSAPSIGRQNVAYKLTGSLSPSWIRGRVRIVCKRYTGGAWRQVGGVRGANISTASKTRGRFSYTFKPPYKGKWSVSVMYPSHLDFDRPYVQASPAVQRYFTVK